MNDDTVVSVDALCNWWGAANGPSGAGPGSGDSITAGVVFQNWRTSAGRRMQRGRDSASRNSPGPPAPPAPTPEAQGHPGRG